MYLRGIEEGKSVMFKVAQDQGQPSPAEDEGLDIIFCSHPIDYCKQVFACLCQKDVVEQLFHVLLVNGGVDRAARFHASMVGAIKLRNAQPPLASNGTMKVGRSN